MSTVEFHRQAAADARAARDAAPNDEVRGHHDRAWAAHFTAMNHFILYPRYLAQAIAARAWATRMLTGERDPSIRAEIEAARDHMIRMPAVHLQHAARWGEEAVKHTARATAAMKAPPPPPDVPPSQVAAAEER